MFSLSVRSYMSEMFTDGLFFLEQGEKAVGEFEQNRFFRFAVIAFCTSVEAALSAQALRYLTENRNSLNKKENKVLYKYLSSTQKFPPMEFRSINSKIETISKFYNINFPKQVRKSYEDLTETRNILLHHKTASNNSIYEDNNLENIAKGAPEIVDQFLSILFNDANSGFYKYRKPSY